jgi:hypothetical protein
MHFTTLALTPFLRIILKFLSATKVIFRAHFFVGLSKDKSHWVNSIKTFD